MHKGDRPWLRELWTDAEVRCTTLQPALSPWLAWVQAYFEARPFSPKWALDDMGTGTAVGWITLNWLKPAPYRAVGFEIRRAFWNRGYATEALETVVRHEGGGKEPISGVVFADNRASQRVFEKVGFACKGKCICEGHDAVLYELVSPRCGGAEAGLKSRAG